MRERGERAVYVEEVIGAMTAEERERFLEERRQRFVMPLMQANIAMLKQKRE